MIKHILFPFDFSRQASLAAPFVGAVASHFDARITLLGIVPPVWNGAPIGEAPVLPVDTREIERDLMSRLEAVPAGDWADRAVQRAVTSGDPAAKIVEFAQSNPVDLIMMPTHGCGMLRSLVIGSVTSKVLHDAKIPVWTATHANEQRSPHAPRTILCAIDDTPESIGLIRWAAEYAQRMGAALKLMHVVPRISDWLELPSEAALQEEMRDHAQAKIDAVRKSLQLDAPLRVGVGNVVDLVVEEARQESAGLVIIGRGVSNRPSAGSELMPTESSRNRPARF